MNLADLLATMHAIEQHTTTLVCHPDDEAMVARHTAGQPFVRVVVSTAAKPGTVLAWEGTLLERPLFTAGEHPPPRPV